MCACCGVSPVTNTRLLGRMQMGRVCSRELHRWQPAATQGRPRSGSAGCRSGTMAVQWHLDFCFCYQVRLQLMRMASGLGHCRGAAWGIGGRHMRTHVKTPISCGGKSQQAVHKCGGGRCRASLALPCKACAYAEQCSMWQGVGAVYGNAFVMPSNTIDA
jgi:hypothetical protein